jgi:hypothetical protein
MRMIDGGFVLDQTLLPTVQLARLDPDRRGDARRCRFEEQSGDVLPPPGVPRPTEPVGIEREAVDEPRLVLLFEAEGHVGADEIGLAPDQRMNVGIDRIGERGDEHPRSVGPHLMLVDPHLRIPLVVDGMAQLFRLDLGEHEPVAIVVVADVVVVKPRQPAALVARAEELAVVVGDHDLPVGIERRNEQKDDVVEAALRLGVAGGGERVRPLHRHLARSDLRRVDVAGDEDDGLAVVCELRDLLLGESAGIGKFLRRVADPIEVPHVPLGGDDDHDEVFAERRFPQRLDPHPRRCGSQSPKVRNDLPVVGKLAVRPDLEPEELGGRLDGGGVGGSGEEKEEDEAFHAGRIMADRRALTI